MIKLISVMLVVAGGVLIVYGVSASHSIGSDFSRLFTGSPTDKSLLLLIGGTVVALIGVRGLFQRSQSL